MTVHRGASYLRARARALLRRHWPMCRRCGIAAFERSPIRDAIVCGGCRREVTGLDLAQAHGRPIRLWLLGV